MTEPHEGLKPHTISLVIHTGTTFFFIQGIRLAGMKAAAGGSGLSAAPQPPLPFLL